MSRPTPTGLRRAGALATAGAWVGFVAVQVVSGDYLPPDVSLSQYGVGPHGWIFTFWMLCVAGSAACYYAAAGVRWPPASVVLAIGIVGTLVMAVVRTDADGLQHSWHAKVHMVGAILTLAALPIGMTAAAWKLGRSAFRAAFALAVLAAAALVLLVLAASGVDTLGSGAATAWAFWQSVAALAEMALLTEFAWAVTRRARISTRA